MLPTERPKLIRQLNVSKPLTAHIRNWERQGLSKSEIRDQITALTQLRSRL